jgi:hypothetical protein
MDKTDPLSEDEEESDLTAFLIVVLVGIAVVVFLGGYAILQRRKIDEKKAHRNFFREE